MHHFPLVYQASHSNTEVHIGEAPLLPSSYESTVTTPDDSGPLQSIKWFSEQVVPPLSPGLT